MGPERILGAEGRAVNTSDKGTHTCEKQYRKKKSIKTSQSSRVRITGMSGP